MPQGLFSADEYPEHGQARAVYRGRVAQKQSSQEVISEKSLLDIRNSIEC